MAQVIIDNLTKEQADAIFVAFDNGGWDIIEVINKELIKLNVPEIAGCDNTIFDEDYHDDPSHTVSVYTDNIEDPEDEDNEVDFEDE